MTDNPPEGDYVIRLEQRLDMPAATRLFETLAERRGGAVVIDAADVEHLGAQCLQVLIASASCWRTDKAAFSISAQSPAFAEALARFATPPEALTAGGAN